MTVRKAFEIHYKSTGYIGTSGVDLVLTDYSNCVTAFCILNNIIYEVYVLVVYRFY